MVRADTTERSGLLLALDPVHLASSPLDEVVIALHHLFEFLAQLGRDSLTLHHRLQDIHALDLELGYDGPVTFAGVIGHDAHFAEAGLFVEPGHLEKLVDHRTHLPRLAVHDLANKQHAFSSNWMRKTSTQQSGAQEAQARTQKIGRPPRSDRLTRRIDRGGQSPQFRATLTIKRWHS